MKKFKKKIMGLLILIYMITAILILFLLNFSYIQSNENEMREILVKSLKTLILIGFPAFR